MIPTATVKARAKKLLAMTTPFVQPPDCTDVFSTTDIVTSFYWGNYSETTLHVSISGPDGSRFTSCQPSGWANVAPQSRFHFSPAVCPSGWTAYHLEPFQTVTPAITTAYCCASEIGETPSVPTTAEGTVSETTVSEATVTERALLTYYPNGVAVHNVYEITWQASDRPTLTPMPPDIPCNDTLRTWVPGSPVAPSSCPTYTNKSEHLPDGPYQFLMIGLPIICILLICACCGTCFHYSRKDRKKQRVLRTQGRVDAISMGNIGGNN
ncbi:hypothetical protein QBC33DRAFT_497975 [Phialemonium atrogriseum]|uniref:Uncharacterized protein n=1 Tax=Phialemonium atrogriseum TaxID=1093897 RepID=A0AAJ0BYC1_9PEZI|nr:uncharacterized protein QBC33DRAFT_497975 [Phialemonium atrogriseum]KAK1764331.1 hypothetical protein QBC33DRAFT_497975 [Phialemonium atrogriseum]